jgi:hypothetical protein
VVAHVLSVTASLATRMPVMAATVRRQLNTSPILGHRYCIVLTAVWEQATPAGTGDASVCIHSNDIDQANPVASQSSV